MEQNEFSRGRLSVRDEQNAAGRDARIVSVNDNPHSQREVAAALNNAEQK